jgi:hypothetical protein
MAGLELKYRIYVAIIIIVIPAISLAIINSIIFISARRSTLRVRPMNGESANVPALSQRDAHLLKHIIFMFAAFFCGWAPIYIVKAIPFSGAGVSPIVLQILNTIPGFSIYIDVIDLFLYNHEFRKYLTNRRLRVSNIRPNQ